MPINFVRELLGRDRKTYVNVVTVILHGYDNN